MAKPNKKKSSPKRKGNQSNGLLKQLVSLNMQQELYGLPNSPDVHWPRLKQNKIHTFVLSSELTTITTSATVPIIFGFAPTISNFPSSPTFLACFDSYRIMCLKFQFSPTVLNSNFIANVVTAIDYDDVSVGSANLSDRDTAQSVPLGRYFERTLVPRVANALYSGSVFTSFGQMKREWIDQVSSTVPHYGLKGTIPSTAVLGAQQVYSVTVKAVVQFRNNF